MNLKKYHGNPILTARPGSWWEKHAALNPGAILHDGKVQLLYRACAETEKHLIYIGLAQSTDGFSFTRVSDEPVIAPSEQYDAGCVEDARVVKLGDWFYVTYACRAWPPGLYFSGTMMPDPPRQTAAFLKDASRTALARSKDLRTFEKLGPITREDVDDRDGILFPEKVGGKYVMLHRPQTWHHEIYDQEKPSIWMTFSDDLLHWEGEHLLAVPQQGWENAKIGGSTPPIRTDEGWLTLYHGVDDKDVYRVGVMMLDLDDPRRVIARSPDFIMEPEAGFEQTGDVGNVVFPCGTVVLGDELFVYYGGADSVCCVATFRFDQLVQYVLRYRQ